VGIDQARHDDHARGIDDLGALGGEIGSNTSNGSVAHQHVRRRKCAERWIDRNYSAALDEIVAA
jgi:hypothetical protein